MTRVATATVDEAPTTSFPSIQGLSADGDVQTKAVLHRSSRPIFLWQHVLQEGAEIHWKKPPVGHVVYLTQGSATIDGRQLDSHGMLLVAHGAEATLRANEAGTTLVHFQRPDDYSDASRRSGGCVHIVNQAEAGFYAEAGESNGWIYADAGCPTCEAWLHRSDAEPGLEVPLHFHSEDEVIFVLEGSIDLGARTLEPGAALAVDAKTLYRFKVGEDGVAFINYRPSEPFFGTGKPGVNPVVSERLGMLDRVAATAARLSAGSID